MVADCHKSQGLFNFKVEVLLGVGRWVDQRCYRNIKKVYLGYLFKDCCIRRRE